MNNTRAVGREAAGPSRVERALEQRLEEQTRELTALLDVSRSAASTLELEPLLNNILDTLKLVVDYSGASIGVVDGDQFRFLESRGASSAEREPEMIGVRLPLRDGSALWEPLFRHQPVIIADIRDASAAAEAYRRTAGDYYDAPAMRYIHSFMAIPLVHRDRLVGVLNMSGREQGVFTERHASLALAIASHIAAAVENARLYGEVQGKAALEERQRLARDLHDSVTQSVFSVGLMANAALGQYERGMPVEDALRRIKAVSHDALAELRALLYELHPAALAAEGLAQALAKLVAAMQVRVDVPVTFTGETARRLGPETETAVFRIVQEALGNAAKYAQATALRVTLVETHAQLSVTVADDGVGYDPQAPVTPSADGHSGGMGLASMRARAATAGLGLRIESAPGAGTRVTLTAPLA